MRPISFKRHRFPLDVIRQAVWLYFRFTLSLRDVERDHLHQLGPGTVGTCRLAARLQPPPAALEPGQHDPGRDGSQSSRQWSAAAGSERRILGQFLPFTSWLANDRFCQMQTTVSEALNGYNCGQFGDMSGQECRLGKRTW